MTKKRVFNKPSQVQGRCRDCGKKETRVRKEYYHAAPPRCLICGGILDRTYQDRQSQRKKTKIKAKKRNPVPQSPVPAIVSDQEEIFWDQIPDITYDCRQYSLDLVVHRFRTQKKGRFQINSHWMFNDMSGRRILDYWPCTGTVCILAKEYRKGNTGVKSPQEALELAKKILSGAEY